MFLVKFNYDIFLCFGMRTSHLGLGHAVTRSNCHCSEIIRKQCRLSSLLLLMEQKMLASGFKNSSNAMHTQNVTRIGVSASATQE